MIMLPGGGYFYVGTLHEGLPVIDEINKFGYNTFVLKYRVDTGGKYTYDYENKAAKDLEVSKDNYSLWGGSAGARTVSCAVYGEGGITKKECVKPALAVIVYVFFVENPKFDKDDSPAFFIVGKKDDLVSWQNVKERADKMKKAGCIVEEHYIDNLEHGFGVGKGTPAEGWIEKAVKFWEKNMINK